MAFVTPDAVVGIIEVKSRIESVSKLEKALQALAANTAKIRAYNYSAFSGLFAFETELGPDKLARILECLYKASNGYKERVVDLVSLGSRLFVLHRERVGGKNGESRPQRWEAYDLVDMAPGYFISNVVHFASPDSVEQNFGAWFPDGPVEKA